MHAACDSSRFLCLQIDALTCISSVVLSIQELLMMHCLLVCRSFLTSLVLQAALSFSTRSSYTTSRCAHFCAMFSELQAHSMHALHSAVLRCVPAYALMHSSKCGTVEHLRQAFPKAGFLSSSPAVCYPVCNNAFRICLTGSCL